APIFAKRFEEEGYSNYEDMGTMEKAVARGLELAKKHDASVVLLSPACASFDQYANFEVRGDDFRKWCLEL
ncbi:MAG: UDP-N-acetylmuramoyl-L-alanine--D-glutamate ligase, partial [Rivularia sp. (in: cyanobacteria)]